MPLFEEQTSEVGLLKINRTEMPDESGTALHGRVYRHEMGFEKRDLTNEYTFHRDRHYGGERDYGVKADPGAPGHVYSLRRPSVPYRPSRGYLVVHFQQYAVSSSLY